MEWIPRRIDISLGLYRLWIQPAGSWAPLQPFCHSSALQWSSQGHLWPSLLHLNRPKAVILLETQVILGVCRFGTRSNPRKGLKSHHIKIITLRNYDKDNIFPQSSEAFLIWSYMHVYSICLRVYMCAHMHIYMNIYVCIHKCMYICMHFWLTNKLDSSSKTRSQIHL